MSKRHISTAFSAFLCAAFLSAATASAQYKLESAGPPPSELSPAIQAVLQKDGAKITGSSGAVCEIWFRTTEPTGAKNTEQDVTLPMIPQGALIGAIRFPVKGLDRRGQTIQPGVYTLRYSDYPVNGDHQGVAPQRDFGLLAPAANDKDPNTTPNFDQLVAMSRKASGTPHPAVFSIWKADQDFKAGFDKQGDTDWVLQTKLGNTPIGIILIGQAGS